MSTFLLAGKLSQDAKKKKNGGGTKGREREEKLTNKSASTGKTTF